MDSTLTQDAIDVDVRFHIGNGHMGHITSVGATFTLEVDEKSPVITDPEIGSSSETCPVWEESECWSGPLSQVCPRDFREVTRLMG